MNKSEVTFSKPENRYSWFSWSPFLNAELAIYKTPKLGSVVSKSDNTFLLQTFITICLTFYPKYKHSLEICESNESVLICQTNRIRNVLNEKCVVAMKKQWLPNCSQLFTFNYVMETLDILLLITYFLRLVWDKSQVTTCLQHCEYKTKI